MNTPTNKNLPRTTTVDSPAITGDRILATFSTLKAQFVGKSIAQTIWFDDVVIENTGNATLLFALMDAQFTSTPTSEDAIAVAPGGNVNIGRINITKAFMATEDVAEDNSYSFIGTPAVDQAP